MHAYLIVGGSRETRAEKLEGVLEQNGVGSRPGQRFVLGGNETRHSEAEGRRIPADLRMTTLKIEDIREAEAWVNLKRSQPAGMIIEEADRLTLPAQHAFLKTLEEPGGNILIVLTAADGLSLLATIRSRCKIIRLPVAAAETADSEKFRKLLNGDAAERLANLYPILKEITGSTASLHRGAVKRGEAIMLIDVILSAAKPCLPAGRNPDGIATSSRPSVGTPRNDVKQLATLLEAAAAAHRRLKNNLNPTLVLHQFVMDIGLKF